MVIKLQAFVNMISTLPGSPEHSNSKTPFVQPLAIKVENFFDKHGGLLYAITVRITSCETTAENILFQVFMESWSSGNFDQLSEKDLLLLLINKCRLAARIAPKNLQENIATRITGMSTAQ